jgi:hypothetical protein
LTDLLYLFFTLAAGKTQAVASAATAAQVVYTYFTAADYAAVLLLLVSLCVVLDKCQARSNLSVVVVASYGGGNLGQF